MLPSAYGANIAEMMPSTYTSHSTVDAFPAQQPTSPDSSRKMSRYPNGRRAGAMRVVKHSSANNSPQSMMARRGTLMNDGSLAQRRQQALDYALRQQMHDRSSYYATHQDQPKQNSRPVSWHPNSHLLESQQMHLQVPQLDLNQFAMSMATPYYAKGCLTGYQNLPPTPTVYSGHTSPASGLSPLLFPYGPATQSAALPAYISDPSIPAPQSTSSCYNASSNSDPSRTFPAYVNQTSFDWHTYSPQGLHSCTTPPTPDECQALHPVQSIPSEESIPFNPLEEHSGDEEDGEILVGMGLYDLPNKSDTDPTLDYYHTTTSQLLDTTYRGGKGWKLEEAWEPPATDDEDTDEDADGEDQGDEPQTMESPAAQQSWI
ncbi:hypothetical protein F4777DRAFT_328838 [Nemania sp. FL0916]|nr:hypothetical protein F4777DRAFT_328838 [Nemania sp. FL0916]